MNQIQFPAGVVSFLSTTASKPVLRSKRPPIQAAAVAISSELVKTEAWSLLLVSICLLTKWYWIVHGDKIFLKDQTY
jgi:hypothetical protein